MRQWLCLRKPVCSVLRDGAAREPTTHAFALSVRIAAPLAEKRNYRVGLLRELDPSKRNLAGLNINKGQGVSVQCVYCWPN